MQVAAFDAIDTGPLNESVWGDSLSKSEDENDIGRIENLGFDGPYSLKNLASTLIMLGI